MRMQSCSAGKVLLKDSDRMVYGADMPFPSASPTPAQQAPEPAAAASAEQPGVDPWASQDPWNCQPCVPEAQTSENQWHLDPFGQGKGKGERPPMACYNCLGLGHPKALCTSPFGAGEQKSTPKCKNCGGFGHDTPTTCTSRGGAKYTPPPAFGKGKGKGKDGKGWQDKGKGTGGSQWGKGAWGKGKGKVSAFDDAQWQWAQGSAQDAQWPPGLTAPGPPWPGAQASAPVEPWMQAAAAPPPWPRAQAAQGTWPTWPGTGSVQSLAGGF